MAKDFIVEISARHVHVTDEDLHKLFGEGYVTIKGPKGEMKASILGPTRKASQVEISLTDARSLGLTAMVRESGDIEGTMGCTLVGPAGEVELPCGVIAAKRHIHMTEADAAEFGVSNGEIVGVEINTDGRSVVYKDTVVRVSNSYALAMHIDTDEGNAAGVVGSARGTIVK